MGKVFQNAVARFPEVTALVDTSIGTRYTYKEWSKHVSDVGSALEYIEVQDGDVVCVAMENRAEMLTLYWATQQIGAAFVPINFRSASDEIAFLVNNVSADILFFSDISRDDVVKGSSQFKDTDHLIFVDSDTPNEATGFETFVANGTEKFEPTVVDPSETSLILHTSGTTGRPKGVPISHQANYARTVGNPIHLSWEPGEVTLGIMPNFHEMGRAAISSTVLLNGTYVAQRSWSPEQALKRIEDEEISMLYLVPTLYHDLVDYDDFDQYDVSSVEKVGYAGTAMSERVHEEILEKFSPREFVNFYGSSEMNCMTTCNWLDKKPGCSGKAGIHTQVRVVEPIEGETVPPDATVESNDLGEIILDASSAEAFDGYLNHPEANATSFQDGWYFTGDLGYEDEDGDVWVVGRVDDMIISGGENIYPVEIEDLLDSHKMIVDVAIGSVTHDRWGELVTAFIESHNSGGSDYRSIAATIDTYCLDSDELADFKRPRKYVFVDEIPKSNVGKKLRRKLQIQDIDKLKDTDVNVLATEDIV